MAIEWKLNPSNIKADGSRADVMVEMTDDATQEVFKQQFTGVLVDTKENRVKFLASIQKELLNQRSKKQEVQSLKDVVSANLEKDVKASLVTWDTKEVK